MYRYVSSESTFRAGNGELYSLDIRDPVIYETSRDAEESGMCCRFEKHNGEVLLVIYPREWNVVEICEKLGRVMRPVAVGEPLARYTAEEFFNTPNCTLKRYVKPEERTRAEMSRGEFEIIRKSFDDLFPDLEEGEGIYIDRSDAWYVYAE